MVDKEYISIGKGTYGINSNTVVWDIPAYNYNNIKAQPKLTVGNFCSVGLGVKIYLGGNHRYDWVTTYPFHVSYLNPNKYSLPNHDGGNDYPGYPHSNGDITIGNDVWIGESSTILSGIEIGDGAVIAANSNVVKNVEPYSIVGGNPTKHIKYRFTGEQITELLKIKWWDMEDSIINELLPFMYSNDINTFIKKSLKFV
jgi:acetyltransferase-like isoleucine patch superfamily enzyme|tara:strand:- start:81 stop:677 length:597 start_codon:yes stop_codon:yes gene_type:complete